MHDEYETLLHHYLNGRLNADDKQHFESHLSRCAVCRDALLDWEKIALAVQENAEEEAYTLPTLNIPERRKPMLRVLQPQRSSLRISTVMIAVMFMLAWGVFAIWLLPNTPPTAINLPVLQQNQAQIDTIVLATRHIMVGELIQADDVIVFDLPAEYVPDDAYVSLDDVVGHMARASIVCGQPIVPLQIQPPTSIDIRYFQVNRVLDEIDGCEDISFEPLPDEFDVIDLPVTTRYMNTLDAVEADDLTTRSYPAQLAPQYIQTTPDDFIDGAIVLDVPSGGVMTWFSLVEAWFTEGGYSVAEISRDQILNDISSMQFGDTVYLGSVFEYVDVNGTTQAIESDTVIASRPPTVIFQPFADQFILLSSPQVDFDTILLGILNDQGAVLADFLNDADMSLLLVHSMQNAIPVPTNEYPDIVIPTGMVAIPIPVSRLNSVSYGIQIGDEVYMLFTNIDGTQASYEGLVVEYASVIDEDIVTMAVNPSDAQTILDAIEGDAELILRLREDDSED